MLDGAAYNLPEQLKDGGGRASQIYRKAFGDDPEVWRDASPTLHVGQAALPPFLIFHAGDRQTSAYFSRQLAERLRQAGGRAEVVHAPDKSHGQINQHIGTAQDGIGERILEFLSL